jgi:hypothetical protein
VTGTVIPDERSEIRDPVVVEDAGMYFDTHGELLLGPGSALVSLAWPG